MKITKTLSVLAALALVAVVGAPVAEAVCAAPFQVNTFDANGYSYIYTPGVCDGGFPCPGDGSSMTPNVRGSFWIIGDGDPAIGLGNDNGTLGATAPGDPYGGFVQLYVGSPALVVTNWAEPGIDGCAIDAVPAGERCVAMLLTDQDADGNGYFLMRTKAATPTNNYPMYLEGDAPMTLAPIARPAITGSTRIDASTVSLDIGAPNILDGQFLDPLCNNPLVGYRVLAQAVPTGAAPPSSRDIADWTDLSGATIPPTSGTSVQVTCSGDQDVYLTTAIDFDSGFATAFVSTNSSRVECGPNLADPVAPRPRLKPGSPIDMRERGGKGGR